MDFVLWHADERIVGSGGVLPNPFSRMGLGDVLFRLIRHGDVQLISAGRGGEDDVTGVLPDEGEAGGQGLPSRAE